MKYSIKFLLSIFLPAALISLPVTCLAMDTDMLLVDEEVKVLSFSLNRFNDLPQIINQVNASLSESFILSDCDETLASNTLVSPSKWEGEPWEIRNLTCRETIRQFQAPYERFCEGKNINCAAKSHEAKQYSASLKLIGNESKTIAVIQGLKTSGARFAVLSGLADDQYKTKESFIKSKFGETECLFADEESKSKADMTLELLNKPNHYLSPKYFFLIDNNLEILNKWIESLKESLKGSNITLVAIQSKEFENLYVNEETFLQEVRNLEAYIKWDKEVDDKLTKASGSRPL